MSNEWLKVMLDEIARKRAEAVQAREELERREAGNAVPGAAGRPASPQRRDDSAQG